MDWNEPEGNKYDVGNPQRFGQDYMDRVANPRDIVQFHAKKTAASSSPPPSPSSLIKRTIEKSTVKIDEPAERDPNRPTSEKIEISQFVSSFLQAQNLGILSEKKMQRAVDEFVEKKDPKAMAK